MKKRQFLSRSVGMLIGAAGLTASQSQAATAAKSEHQTVLTLTGAIDHTNRGRFDEVLDQLMHKHGIHFERAFDFTLADLAKLPAVSINPTMEYDAKLHRLTGPRLADVLNAAGISKEKPTKIILHGIDGYSPEITLAQALADNFIVATHLDGKLLHIGGFGPLFAIYDADRITEIAAKPLSQRFSVCPWGLYCIELA
jgi:hypothetical protein